MKKTNLYPMFIIMISLCFFFAIGSNLLPSQIIAYAEEYDIPVFSYETEKDYDYSGLDPVDKMSYGEKALGNFMVSGNINSKTKYKDVNGKEYPAYGLNTRQLSFSYSYDGKLLDEDGPHYLLDDTKKKYNGKKLGAKINKGTSFGAAIVAISKVTVGFAFADGLGTLAIETTKNIFDGMTITEAIKGASGKGLDSFVIGAAVGGVKSVATALINPIVSKVNNAEKIADYSTDYLRNKAVKDAWKIERKAVLTNTSRYKWTIKQKLELITTGKIKGMEGHHIRTVKELADTSERLFIADPNDIVFLSKQQHLLMHSNNFNNVTDTKTLLKLMPWVEKRLVYLGA